MIQAEEFQRREWQNALDDLMHSILRQPQATASKERKEIFEAWRKRMEARFRIGSLTEIGRPPLADLIRDTSDFHFVERRLEEILGLARDFKGVRLSLLSIVLAFTDTVLLFTVTARRSDSR